METDAARRETPGKLLGWLSALHGYLGSDFLGGPRFIKLSWVINLQKGLTLPFVALLMVAYGNYSTAAWVYLALHGAYGLCWIMKSLAFPDVKWERRATLGSAVLAFVLVLGLYWVAPFLLVSGALGAGSPAPTNARLAASIILHTLGLAIMLSADAQKYFTLQARLGLITTGMFTYTRNPNYLGEMMVYGAYALLVGHWLPWAILIYLWIFFFLVNMKMKDISLSRYPGWEDYRRQSALLIPWPLLTRGVKKLLRPESSMR